jgi:hypothetical protein
MQQKAAHGNWRQKQRHAAAHAEESDLTDTDQEALRALQEEYFEASIEDRDRLRPTLVQKMRDAYPEAAAILEKIVGDGSFLLAMFKHCLRSALARPDLSNRQKNNIIEDMLDFYFMHWQLGNAKDGRCARETAVELARAALFVGAMAGRDPDEIEKLRKRFMAEHQRKAAAKGAESRRDKPWQGFAKAEALHIHTVHEALHIHKVHPGFLAEIARRIQNSDEWKSGKFEIVEHQQLCKYLSNLVDKDELPSSMKRRRNTTCG